MNHTQLLLWRPNDICQYLSALKSPLHYDLKHKDWIIALLIFEPSINLNI